MFRVHPPPKTHILFYSNGLAIKHGLPNIGYVKMNNGRKSGHFEFDQVNFFQDASSSEISHFVL